MMTIHEAKILKTQPGDYPC